MKGYTQDPATQEYPYRMWQSLPSWFMPNGQYAKAIGTDKLPATWKDEMLKDPCKQAYLTNQIRKEHCIKEGKINGNYRCDPWSAGGRGGPISSAPGFCNSGWTGDCPVGMGGQTPDGPTACAYYRKNPHYHDFCTNSKTCQTQCSQHQPC